MLGIDGALVSDGTGCGSDMLGPDCPAATEKPGQDFT